MVAQAERTLSSPLDNFPDNSPRVLKVLMGLKQVVILVETNDFPYGKQALFRPEKTLHVSPDARVPIPEELYRDVAYHRVDALLGWQVSAPVVPWELKPGEKGVLRPYWTEVGNVLPQAINLSNMKDNMLFWQKVAILDYLCAVVDRCANDILIIKPQNDVVIIDSGLSFVKGIKFVTQNSLIRDALRGISIDEVLLNDLESLTLANLTELEEFVGLDEIEWVIRRKEKLLKKKKII